MKRQSLCTTNLNVVIFPPEILVQQSLCGLIKLPSVAADPQQFKFTCFFDGLFLLFWDL